MSDSERTDEVGNVVSTRVASAPCCDCSMGCQSAGDRLVGRCSGNSLDATLWGGLISSLTWSRSTSVESFHMKLDRRHVAAEIVIVNHLDFVDGAKIPRVCMSPSDTVATFTQALAVSLALHFFVFRTPSCGLGTSSSTRSRRSCVG